MIEVFSPQEWKNVTPKKGETILLEMPDGTYDLVLLTRSAKPIQVNAIGTDGEPIFIQALSGTDSLTERLRDVVGIELVPEGPFSYLAATSIIKATEVLDPTPVTESFTIGPMDHIRQLVEQEIRSRLGHLIETGAIQTEAEIDELVSEALEYDHDFEDDDDEYGDGWMEDEDAETFAEKQARLSLDEAAKLQQEEDAKKAAAEKQAKREAKLAKLLDEEGDDGTTAD